MKRSKLTIFGASAAALALALSACGAQSSNGDLSKVQYTLKNATAEPEASSRLPSPLLRPSAYVIEEGNGDVHQRW